MNQPPIENNGTFGVTRGQIVQTSPGNLTPPENIIQTVAAAKEIYFTRRTEHLPRIQLYAAIEGLFAGNPPYSAADLAKARLQHISNFNNLDARAIYERGATTYWNLINEARTLCRFELHLPGADPAEVVKWADSLAKNLDKVVRSWESFTVAYNTLTAQIVKFGISPAVWSDERDWRWRTVELSRFYVEDQAQTDISLLGCICVENIFTAQYLFTVYQEMKDKPKDETPWDTDELANLLIFFANQAAKDRNEYVYDMMQLQLKLQNLDYNYGAIFSDDIRLVSLLYKEYDEKISHYMFHPKYDTGKFLFFADRQYKCMSEAIVIFTASPGEMTIHSNRGLGHKIFSGSQAMMQLDCSIVDMAKMAATPLFNTSNVGGKEFSAIRFYAGVPCDIGGATAQQNTFGENINQLIEASRYIFSKLQFNTMASGDDPSVPDASTGSKSAPEVRLKSFKEFALPKNSINHFYVGMDVVWRNMVIKMLHSKDGYPGYEEAKRWKELCKLDGVPELVFATGKESDRYYGMPPQMEVYASRAAGDGSNLARILGLEALAQDVPSYGPKGMQEFLRQRIEVFMGPEYVDAFLDDASLQQDGDSLAGLENVAMQIGKSPVFSFSNIHKLHMLTHLALGNDTIQRIQQQQMGAIEADKIFVVLIPHMQEHWDMLLANPYQEAFVKSMSKTWAELSQYAQLNHHNAAKEYQAAIRKQQQQAEKTQQVLTDEQLKMLQVQGEEQRAERKLDSQLANADKANDTRAELKREEIQNKAANDRLKVTLEAQNKPPVEAEKEAIEQTPLPILRAELQEINGSSPSPYNLERN